MTQAQYTGVEWPHFAEWIDSLFQPSFTNPSESFLLKLYAMLQERVY